MTAAKVINFPKPSLLQGAILNTQKNEDGFTPLPNFICDEGYLAVLEGEAIKCLVFLNRHIKGFHLSNKGMSETLVKKITGIKDGRTVQKYMSQLARYQLVKIDKDRGKSNVYSLTFEDRLPTQHVGTSHAPTQNVPTSRVGSLPTQHVGSSTHITCGSVKEIDLKENLKDKKSIFPVDNSKTEMFSDSVKYHEDNKNQYSLRELASTYTIQTDLANQAKQIDPKLDDAKIMSELKNFAQWSVGREKTTAQGWMNYWIYRIQKLSAPKAKTAKPAKAKSKGLSDAQLNYFASKLCNFGTFASLYSNVGETQKSFEARINANLRKPEYAKTYGPYLAELGFVVDLGDGL
jgi:hypothetical protein